MSQFSGSVISSRTSIEGSVKARLIATNIFVVGKACNMTHTTIPQYLEYFMHLVQLLAFAFNPYVDGNYFAQSFVYALGFFPWWDLNFATTLPLGGYLAFFWIVAALILFYVSVWVVGSFNPHFISANVLSSALRLKYLVNMMASFLFIPFLHTMLSAAHCDRGYYFPSSLDIYSTVAQSKNQRLVPTNSVLGGADASASLSSTSTTWGMNAAPIYSPASTVANAIFSTIRASEDPNVIRSRRSDPSLFFIPMEKCGWGYESEGGNGLMLGHRIVGIIFAVFLIIATYIKISCRATTELQPLLLFERGNNVGEQALFIAKIGLVLAFQILISSANITTYTVIVAVVLFALAAIHVIYMPFMNVVVHRFTVAAYATIGWLSFTCFISSLQRTTASNEPTFIAFGGFWAVMTICGAFIFALAFYFSTIRLNQKTQFLLDQVLKPGFVHPKDNPFYVACYNRDPDSLPYPEGLPETDYLFSPFRNIEAEITEEGLSAENEVSQQIKSAGRYGWRRTDGNPYDMYEDDEYNIFGGGEFGHAGGRNDNPKGVPGDKSRRRKTNKNNQSSNNMKADSTGHPSANTSGNRKSQYHRASKAAMLRAALRIQVVSPTVSVALTPYDAEIAVRFLYEWNLKTGRRPTPHMLAFACRIFAKFLMRYPDSGVVHLSFVRFLTTFAPSKSRMRLSLDVLESVPNKAAFLLMPELYEIFLLSLSVSDTLGERDRTHLHLYHRVRTTHRKTLIGIAAFWRSLSEDSDALKGDLVITNENEDGIILDDEGSMTFAGAPDRKRIAQKEQQHRRQRALAAAAKADGHHQHQHHQHTKHHGASTSIDVSAMSPDTYATPHNTILGTSVSDGDDEDTNGMGLQPISTLSAINSLISLCHFANSLSSQREKAYQLYMSTLNVAADDELLYVSFADFCETVLHNYDCADICRAEAKNVNYQKRKRLLEGVTGFGFTGRMSGEANGNGAMSYGSSSDANTQGGSSGEENNGNNFDTVSRAPSMTSYAPERGISSSNSKGATSSRRSGNSTTLIGSQKDAWIGASLPLIRASLDEQKQLLGKQINASSLRCTVIAVLVVLLSVVAIDIAVVVTQLQAQIDMSSRLHSLGELRRLTQTLPARLQQAIDEIDGENFVRTVEYEYRFEAYTSEVNRFIAISSKLTVGSDKPKGDKALVELFERPIAFFKTVTGVPKGAKVDDSIYLSQVPLQSQVPTSMATYTSANIIETCIIIASSADAATKVLFQTPIPSKAAVLDEECVKFILNSVSSVGSIAFDLIIQKTLELGQRNVKTSQIAITISFAITMAAIVLCYCAFVWEFRKGSVQKAKILALFHLIPADALRRLAEDAKLKTEAFIAASAATNATSRSHTSIVGGSTGGGSSTGSGVGGPLNASSPGSGPADIQQQQYFGASMRRPLFDTGSQANQPMIVPGHSQIGDPYTLGLVNFPTLMMDSSLGAFPNGGGPTGSPMDIYGNTPQSAAALGGIVMGPASSTHTDAYGNTHTMLGNGSSDSNSKSITAATNNAANLVLAANASGIGVTMMRLLQSREVALQANSSFGASSRGNSGRMPAGIGGSVMGPNPLLGSSVVAPLMTMGAPKSIGASHSTVLGGTTDGGAGQAAASSGGEYTLSLLVRLKDQQLAHSQTRSSGANGLSKRTSSFDPSNPLLRRDSNPNNNNDTPSSSGQGGNSRLSPVGNANAIGSGALNSINPIFNAKGATMYAPPPQSTSPAPSTGTRTPPPQPQPIFNRNPGLPPRPTKAGASSMPASSAKVSPKASFMSDGEQSPPTVPLSASPQTVEPSEQNEDASPILLTTTTSLPSSAIAPKTALKSAFAVPQAKVRHTDALKPKPLGVRDDDDVSDDTTNSDYSDAEDGTTSPIEEGHATVVVHSPPAPGSDAAKGRQLPSAQKQPKPTAITTTAKATVEITTPSVAVISLTDQAQQAFPADRGTTEAPLRRRHHGRARPPADGDKNKTASLAVDKRRSTVGKVQRPNQELRAQKQQPLVRTAFQYIVDAVSLQHDATATSRFLKELRALHLVVLLALIGVAIGGFAAAAQHFASNTSRVAKAQTSENGIGCVYRLSVIADRMMSTTSDFVSTASYVRYRDAIDAYERWQSARWCAEWETRTLQESDYDKEVRGVKTVLPTAQTGGSWYASQSSSSVYGTSYTSTPSTASPDAATPSAIPSPSTSSSVLATEYFRLSDALERPTLIALLLGAKVAGFDDMLAPEVGGLRYTRENKTLALSMRYDLYDEAAAMSHAYFVNSTLIMPNTTNTTNASSEDNLSNANYLYDEDAEVINLLNSFYSSSSCRLVNFSNASMWVNNTNSSLLFSTDNTTSSESVVDSSMGSRRWYAYSSDVKDVKKTRNTKWSIAIRTSMDRFISADYSFYRSTLKELFRQIKTVHADTVDQMVTGETAHSAVVATAFGILGLFFALLAFVFIRDKLGFPIFFLFSLLAAASFTTFYFGIEMNTAGRALRDLNRETFETVELFTGVHRVESIVRNARMFILSNEHPAANLKDFIILTQISDPSVSTAPSYVSSDFSQLNNIGKLIDEMAMVRPDLPLKINTALGTQNNITKQGRNQAVAVAEVQRLATIAVVLAASAIIDDCSLVEFDTTGKSGNYSNTTANTPAYGLPPHLVRLMQKIFGLRSLSTFNISESTSEYASSEIFSAFYYNILSEATYSNDFLSFSADYSKLVGHYTNSSYDLLERSPIERLATASNIITSARLLSAIEASRASGAQLAVDLLGEAVDALDGLKNRRAKAALAMFIAATVTFGLFMAFVILLCYFFVNSFSSSDREKIVYREVYRRIINKIILGLMFITAMVVAVLAVCLVLTTETFASQQHTCLAHRFDWTMSATRRSIQLMAVAEEANTTMSAAKAQTTLNIAQQQAKLAEQYVFFHPSISSSLKKSIRTELVFGPVDEDGFEVRDVTTLTAESVLSVVSSQAQGLASTAQTSPLEVCFPSERQSDLGNQIGLAIQTRRIRTALAGTMSAPVSYSAFQYIPTSYVMRDGTPVVASATGFAGEDSQLGIPETVLRLFSFASTGESTRSIASAVRSLFFSFIDEISAASNSFLQKRLDIIIALLSVLAGVIVIVFAFFFWPAMEILIKQEIGIRTLFLQLPKVITNVVPEIGDFFEFDASSKDDMLKKKLQQSEKLLQSILPPVISRRLKNGEVAIADTHADVTVVFAALVGLEIYSSSMPAKSFVVFLNSLMIMLDRIVDMLGLEKIKTIGDVYFLCGGLTKKTSRDHAIRCVECSLFFMEALNEHNIHHKTPLLSFRIGVNTGPAVAGVIGSTKVAYDLWGDSVNTASRMQSTGKAGEVQCSQSTYSFIKDKYVVLQRSITAKGKGVMTTYVVVDRCAPTGFDHMSWRESRL